jgi:hypothetical protein
MADQSQPVPAQTNVPTGGSSSVGVPTRNSVTIPSALVPLFRERPLAGDESAEEYNPLLGAVVSSLQPVAVADGSV